MNPYLFLVNDLEPGLALMDEIGRTALTNAFINFTRNTCDPSAYRDQSWNRSSPTPFGECMNIFWHPTS